jgi:hypothetical protein
MRNCVNKQDAKEEQYEEVENVNEVINVCASNPEYVRMAQHSEGSLVCGRRNSCRQR